MEFVTFYDVTLGQQSFPVVRVERKSAAFKALEPRQLMCSLIAFAITVLGFVLTVYEVGFLILMIIGSGQFTDITLLHGGVMLLGAAILVRGTEVTDWLAQRLGQRRLRRGRLNGEVIIPIANRIHTDV